MKDNEFPSDRPVPSEHDRRSPERNYDEPPVRRGRDVAPESSYTGPTTGSLAELRLRVEQLLTRREPPDVDAWSELGPQAPRLLVRLIDDPVIARSAAVRDRVIATLAQLGVVAAIPRLSEIMLDRSEPLVTRAQAVNAVGRIGDPGAIAALARATRDREPSVRRQVAHALGRLGDAEAVPHLQVLAHDSSTVVVEAANKSLRRYEELLGVSGLASSREPAKARATAPRKPSAERGR
jgi:hypothetical protein